MMHFNLFINDLNKWNEVILMKRLRHTLIVHVIPVTLMIVVMAVAMMYVSQRLH